MKKFKKIYDDKLQDVNGGEKPGERWTNENCTHPSLSKYNEYREKSWFVFWSIKQQRCRCQYCFEEIWIDVEK